MFSLPHKVAWVSQYYDTVVPSRLFGLCPCFPSIIPCTTTPPNFYHLVSSCPQLVSFSDLLPILLPSFLELSLRSVPHSLFLPLASISSLFTLYLLHSVFVRLALWRAATLVLTLIPEASLFAFLPPAPSAKRRPHKTLAFSSICLPVARVRRCVCPYGDDILFALV